MPYLKKHDTVSESIRKADRIRFGGREYTVDHVDVKTKYVYLTFEEDTDPYKLERSAKIKVWREEATPRENFVRNESRVVEMFLKGLIDASIKFDMAKANLKNKLDSPYMIDHRDMDRVTEAQAVYHSMKRAERGLFHKHKEEVGHELPFESADDPEFQWTDHLDDSDIVNVMNEWIEEIHREVWRGGSTWSGNSSANAMDTIRIEKLKELYDRYGPFLSRLAELGRIAETWTAPDEG